MKKLIPLAVPVLLSLLLLSQIGCDSDEDINTAVGPCDITLTRPLPGEVFFSGDEVKVYWRNSGVGSQVRIELLKGVEVVGFINDRADDDGYYFWYADNMEQPNGDDFSVKITSVESDGCGDQSPQFSLTNVIGCNFDFITPPTMVEGSEDTLKLYADGSTYEVTWFSAFTTGNVNLQLKHLNDIVGYIATNVPDSNQSYTWNIDSLHYGSGSSFRIEIIDVKVSHCTQLSEIFDIVDTDICSIDFINPMGDGIVVHLGDIYNIQWIPEQVEGTLDIALYYNNALIDIVAQNVDPEQRVYAWEVWLPGVIPEDNAATYVLKLTDNANSVAPCSGRSDSFLVTN